MIDGSAPRQELTALIAPIVAGAGFDLEDVVVTPAGRRSVVRVVVDGDDGVSLDDVADVSRAVSAALDEADGAMGKSAYVLEVTSPGVDRPLTQPRHWRRAAGRLVQVSLGEAGQLRGRVLHSDDSRAVLDVGGAVQEIRYEQVEQARVNVEFTRPAGTEQP
ncbi:ribosome maturation factor RimP [soil metagenome]